MKYVHTCRAKSNDENASLPIRKDLIVEIVSALRSQSLRKVRNRQKMEDVVRKEDDDFTLEQADLEIVGRLDFSASRWNEEYMHEI